MPTAENGILYYEAGQTYAGIVELTDQGDQMEFLSADNLWSKYQGKAPVVRPNGLATGGVVIPAVAAGNNNVDIAALTAYLAGVLTSVGAGTNQAITRGAVDAYKISSIQITSAGAISVVAGTEGAAFVETRGVAGGPPFVLVGSIEIAQVRFSSLSAAPVLASEIFQVAGTHLERYDSPTFTAKPFNVESGVMGYAGIDFISALPKIHTGSLPKKVYAEYYEPIFAE
ncbi:MAG: hypothetical protein A2V65_01255, partial [Deltaproteobacteria bacterium RBG_13_49_15]